MANNMDNRMVALCSAAIGIVYASGYFVTMPGVSEPERQIAAAAPMVTTQPPQTADVPTPGPGLPNGLQQYRDGIYTGLGYNGIGGLRVAVTIKDGLISDVQITECWTHYSQSYINQLPEQVIARQNDDVEVVTGATASTQAFRMAVSKALSEARM
ncbi:MAG TPA: FMN-binding protein [Symbiobacteriaceae bacterium]|nr:FMN-binding protein [Symbiobacteriaceae bacterium]